MAPVPEENQDTPPNDSSEHFSNPNLTIPIGGSDSSDSDDSEENTGAPNGYSLLPQEPEDDNGFHSDDENVYNTEDIGHNIHHLSASAENVGGAENAPDALTESALSSEGAVAPTVSASNESLHPAFLAMFPDGKIPSYMQVPKVPKDRQDHLWNEQRQESSTLTIDPVHESKILKVMSQFSLPTENIPDWARNLPDDQWHQQVLSRIGIVSDRDTHSTNTKASSSSSSSETKAETKDFLATDDVWVADFASSTGQK